MKFSPTTLTLLKNFAMINPGLSFKEGNRIHTMSPEKTILAEGVIAETIPQNFVIHDMNTFLSVFSLTKDSAELEFDAHHVIIVGNKGRSRITYRCCEEVMIVAPSKKNITLPSEDIRFTLSEADLTWILKSASVLQSPHLRIEAHPDRLTITTLDAHNDSAHTDTLEVPLTPNSEPSTGSVVLKTEHLKILPGTYDVTISLKGIIQFSHHGMKLDYWITAESGLK